MKRIIYLLCIYILILPLSWAMGPENSMNPDVFWLAFDEKMKNVLDFMMLDSIEDMIILYGDNYEYTTMDAYNTVANAEKGDSLISYDYHNSSFEFYRKENGRHFLYSSSVYDDFCIKNNKLYLGMTLNELEEVIGVKGEHVINDDYDIVIEYPMYDGLLSVYFYFNDKKLVKIFRTII